MIGSFPERFLYMLVNRCLPSTYLYRCICSISGSTWSGGSTKQKSLGTNCVAITSSEWSSNLNWAWKEMVPICPDGLPELFGWALIPKDCRKGSYFSKWIFGLLCLRAGIYIYIPISDEIDLRVRRARTFLVSGPLAARYVRTTICLGIGMGSCTFGCPEILLLNWTGITLQTTVPYPRGRETPSWWNIDSQWLIDQNGARNPFGSFRLWSSPFSLPGRHHVGTLRSRTGRGLFGTGGLHQRYVMGGQEEIGEYRGREE